MRSPLRPGPLLLALLAVLAPLPASIPPAAAFEGADASAREWCQWRGNAARTGFVESEPLRAEPVVAWRRPVDPLASNLVSWGGTLFYVTRGKTTLLHAVRAATGEPVGDPRTLGEGGELLVWQGTVVTWSRGTLRGFPYRGSSFGLGWTRPIPDLGPPVLYRGILYASDGRRLHAVEARTGRLIEKGGDFPSTGRPALASDETARAILVGAGVSMKHGGSGRDMNYYATLYSLAGSILEKGKIADAEASVISTAPFGEDVKPGGLGGTPVDVQRVPPSGEEEHPGGWLLTAGVDFYKAGKRAVIPSLSSEKAYISTLETEPAAWKGRLFGFSGKGLVSQNGDGAYATIVEKAMLPRGAQAGPASGAKDILYLGNWAVELQTSRVLWCVPESKRVAECIPAGDGVVVYTLMDKYGATTEMVGLADPAVLAAAKASPAPAAAGPEAPRGPGPAPAPSSEAAAPAPPPDDGVVLQDGRCIAGKVEAAAAGGVRLTPPAGDPRELADADVALVMEGGRVRTRHGEDAAYRAWREALRPAWVAVIGDLFERLARERLLGPCRALLAEGRDWGMDPLRLEALERRLTDRQENTNTPGRMKALGPELDEVRRRAREPFVKASSWCRERGLATAASVLLLDADRILPGGAAGKAALKECIPAEFPWAGETDAAARWAEWARDLLAADAAFAAPADPLWKRAARPPWNEGALLIRTRHFSFLTRCRDAGVVGRCLREGEWTVRVLETLVGRDEVRPWVRDDDLMDVRLHGSRDDYMKEKLPGGGHAMPWSAGIFSPAEGASRFFVPDAKEGDALGRGLFHVMSHELTHHFLERRWFGVPEGDRSDPRAPGFWCIEGVARFVEDQVVEMDRRGLRFDDPTVPSLDSTAQAAKDGWVFPPSKFLELSHEMFAHLPSDAGYPVQLRNTLQVRMLTPLCLFYEQAGATVYFLVNGRGAEGRAAFFRYLSDFYRGRDTSPGWLVLGFPDAKGFDGAFMDFLKSVR
jgi:hypothetical protein